MTDSQIRYQTLMENQRHNFAMEKIAGEEADIKQQQADTAKRQAEISQQQADTAERQASVAEKSEQRRWWERSDSNIWKGLETWTKSVSNAINFVRLFF